MAVVLISQGVGKPILTFNTLDKYGKAKVGRWAKAPLVPDRCDDCPLADQRPAIGFRSKGGYRFGYCEEHRPQPR